MLSVGGVGAVRGLFLTSDYCIREFRKLDERTISVNFNAKMLVYV